MAKVVATEHDVVAEPWWAKGKSVGFGLAAGASWWVLATLLNKYVIEPFACRDLAVAESCVQSFGTSGNIAAVLVAVIFAYILVRNLQPRPIIVAVASLALLWGLGDLTDGLSWWTTLLWALGLYAISYALFTLVARLKLMWLSLVVAAVVVVAIRIILAL